MNKIDRSTHLIVRPFRNETEWLKVRNVLTAHDVYLNRLNYVHLPAAIRLCHNTLNYSSDARYYDDAWFNPYEKITPEEFLERYQTPYEHRGYKGSYEYSTDDRCWFGWIEGEEDLVTYESESLIGLEHQFVAAVNNYIQTLEELKEKEKNMKELKWQIVYDPEPFSRGYCITTQDETQFLADDGSVVTLDEFPNRGASELFWAHKNEAEEFIEEMCDSNPNIMYVVKVDPVFDADVIQELTVTSVVALIESVVEQFMKEERTFTRHDVCKGIRQVVGPDVKIEYDEWKELIVEVIETSISLYDYSRQQNNGRFEYFYDPTVEDEEDDVTTDTVTIDSAQTVTTGIPAGTVAAVTTGSRDYSDTIYTPDLDAPSKDVTRHTLTAEQIRNAGGKPGDILHVMVTKGNITFDIDEKVILAEWKKMGSPQILHQSSFKVDKNCNVRLSKYIFDLADMGKWFGRPFKI